MTKVFILSKEADVYSFAKKIAAEKYNIDTCKIQLAKGVHGKPFFENLTDFHFNISHSGELNVIAVSDKAVGIDIEKLRNADLRIAKRFCEDEYNFIKQNAALSVFFEIWTKKEAYLKLLGTGISGGLNSFSVFKIDKPLKTFEIDGYIISACGDSDFEIVDLR